MTPGVPRDAPEPLSGSVITYLVPLAVGLGYFVFLGWLVAMQAEDRPAAWLATAIHAILFSAMMTWLWWPGRNDPDRSRPQFSLRGILGLTAVVGICVSYVTQVLQAVQPSRPANLPSVVLFSVLFFMFSLPYASILGTATARIAQILWRRRRG